MTRTSSHPAPASSTPDARLVRIHAQRGNPHARLAQALAALEGADWGLTLAGERALAAQLAALLGSGVLRIDPSLGLSRSLLAERGLAAAGLEGDWQGARAVWLTEPSPEALSRAQRAGAKVIVDGTLAPGGDWLNQGADFVTYSHAATLTGFGDTELALLFGRGDAPAPAAPAPSDLSVSLALRDVATLPLRLARAAQTTAELARLLGGGALPFGPTALLLPPDAAPTTDAPLGGVLAAARAVGSGVVLTPGLQSPETALALLRAEPGNGESETRSSPRREETASTRPEQAARPAPKEAAETPVARPERPNREERGGRDSGRRRDLRPTGRAGDRPDRPLRPQLSRPAPDMIWHPAAKLAAQQAAEQAADVGVAPDPVPPRQSHSPKPLSGWPLKRRRRSNRCRPPQAAPSQPEPLAAAKPAEEGQPQAASPAAPPIAPLSPDLPLSPSDAETSDLTADLTSEQAAIFARLREWRNAEAARQEVSRFIVASNATLAEIARRVPYTLADLREVRGMGPARIEKYGDAILKLVRS
ncbi:HRDC domain-containing protein [Deinococcus lacus]|uniref:HRDC domain-containing protein n=1 Tax=Deinococcus lacus TaxID=392561 RepID=A0ABW1YD17_9DEIO